MAIWAMGRKEGGGLEKFGQQTWPAAWVSVTSDQLHLKSERESERDPAGEKTDVCSKSNADFVDLPDHQPMREKI